MSNANSIKVVARFRPQNKVELAAGGEPIVTFEGNDTLTVEVGLVPRAGFSMAADPALRNSPRKPRAPLPLIGCLE